MKFLIIFLISFNLWAAAPLFSINDSVKTNIVSVEPVGTLGVIKRVWTGSINVYLVEFPDGYNIQFDEDQITLNP